MLQSTLLLAAASSDPWADTFFGLDSAQRFVALLTIAGCVTGIIVGTAGILFSALNGIHRRRIEAELKRDMLDRGMSADEVVKVIEAAAPPEDATQRWIASWCRKK